MGFKKMALGKAQTCDKMLKAWVLASVFTLDHIASSCVVFTPCFPDLQSKCLNNSIHVVHVL